MQEMLSNKAEREDLIGEQQKHFSGKKYSQPGMHTNKSAMIMGIVLQPDQTLPEVDSEEKSMRNNTTSNTKKNNMIELVNRKSAKKIVADTDEDC